MNQILICMYDLDSVNMLVYFVVRNFFVTLKCINMARSIKAVNFDLYIHGSNMQKNNGTLCHSTVDILVYHSSAITT